MVSEELASYQCESYFIISIGSIFIVYNNQVLSRLSNIPTTWHEPALHALHSWSQCVKFILHIKS